MTKRERGQRRSWRVSLQVVTKKRLAKLELLGVGSWNRNMRRWAAERYLSKAKKQPRNRQLYLVFPLRSLPGRFSIVLDFLCFQLFPFSSPFNTTCFFSSSAEDHDIPQCLHKIPSTTNKELPLQKPKSRLENVLKKSSLFSSTSSLHTFVQSNYLKMPLNGTKRFLPLLFLQLTNQNLEYNTPGGKLNRGLSVVDTYQILVGKPLEEEIYMKASILGWTVELVFSICEKWSLFGSCKRTF